MGKHYRICQAMIDAGIGDPESQEGKDFCTKKCPYSSCVVFDNGVRPSTLRRLENIKKAKELWAERLTLKEIAKRLNKSERTIERYLS